ncbi:MAG: hypothetical protein ACKO5C_09375 [Ferruginibacter sp.]
MEKMRDMKKYIPLLIFFLAGLSSATHAQVVAIDSLPELPESIIHIDKRVMILGLKMADYHTTQQSIRGATLTNSKGFRLMLISSTDRNQVLQLRSKLLAQFPEHKTYLTFISPYLKLKMGNFVSRSDAEQLRTVLLSRKLVSGNVYVVPETIEVKATAANPPATPTKPKKK